MSLFAPLFLLGIGLIALPIWLHRLQAETPQRKSFASSMFLQASEQPVHVRRRLRYWLLLALRVLFLLLLALAFSRPFWAKDDTVDISVLSTLDLVVIDSSASMSAAYNDNSNRIEQARAQAIELVNQLGADEVAQVFSVDQALLAQTQITNSKAELSAAIEGIDATETPLSYDFVARSLEGLLSADAFRLLNVRIHFISDFQQSAMPGRFADLVPEPNSTVRYQFLNYSVVANTETNQIGGVGANSNNANNTTIQPLENNLAIDQVQMVGQAARVSVRSHYGSTVLSNQDNQLPTLDFQIRARANAEDWQIIDAEIPVTGRQTYSIDNLELEPDRNRIEIELLINDVLDSDNRFHYVENRSAPEPLLLLTENPFGPSALYLSALFPEKVDLSSKVASRNYVATPQAVSAFDARTLERYSWVLIDDIGIIDSVLASELRSYVSNGGAVFAAAGPASTRLTQLPVLDIGIAGSTSLFSSSASAFAKASFVDQGHPGLNGILGWSELRFENWLEMDQSGLEQLNEEQAARVLIQLDSGDPLLVETGLGRGKLMLLTSSLDNQWNNLPVKPLFVGMMRSMAEYLSGAEIIAPQAYAGDSLRLEGSESSAGQLVDPDGNAVLALGSSLQSDQLKMQKTGFYQAYTASGEYLIGVNLNPQESDMTSLSSDALQRWQQLADRTGEPSSGSSSQQTGSNGSTEYSFEQNSYNGLWFWLLAVAAVAILFESILANLRLSQRTAVLGSGAGTRVLAGVKS